MPLVINANPQNGSDNISLTQTLSVVFDRDLDPATVNHSTVVLENMSHYGVPDYEVTLDGKTEVTLTLLPGEEYRPLNEYRLTIYGIQSSYGEVMRQGSYILTFTTESGAIENWYEETPPEEMLFEVAKIYPWDGSVRTPDKIRVAFSHSIAQTPLTADNVLLIQDDTLSTIEEAVFMGENLLIAPVITLLDKEIEVAIPEGILSSGERYVIVVKDILDTMGREIYPHFSIFYTQPDPFYGKTSRVLVKKAVKVLAKDMTEMDVAMLMHENSKVARFIAERHNNLENIDWLTPDLFVEKYVETKTQYDIIFDQFISISSGYSARQLADLRVEFNNSLGDVLKIADALKLEYLSWEEYLKGKVNRGSAKSETFVRGENADEVPDYKNRSLRDIGGIKSW